MLDKLERHSKVFLRRVLPEAAIAFLHHSVRPWWKTVWRAPLAAWRRTLPVVEEASLVKDLQAAGVRPGDVLMVHSALSKIGNVDQGAAAVIRSLMTAVTPDGTILMPCHNSPTDVMEGAARGAVFDMRSRKPNTGTIPATFVSWPGVLRSSHPFSSSCAWGKHASYVTKDHDADPRICHKDSPLGRLLELQGKLVGIGVSIGPVGFYHVLEDTWDGFPFEVYLPEAPVSYIDGCGTPVTRNLRRYDPRVARMRIEKPEAEGIRAALTGHFARRGILRYFSFGGARSWIMETRPLYDELKRLATLGITICSTAEEFRAVERSGAL